MTVTRGELIDAYLAAAHACHAQAVLLTTIDPPATPLRFDAAYQLRTVADKLGTVALWHATQGELDEELS